MRRVFVDTEFSELSKNGKLLSIGIVDETGKRKFYRELEIENPENLNDWVRENVLPHLKDEKVSKDQLKVELTEFFLSFGEKVEVWLDVGHFDWVLFVDIFGTAFDIPQNIYYIPVEFSTVLRERGFDPDTSRRELSGWFTARPHHALDDAEMLRRCVIEIECGGEERQEYHEKEVQVKVIDGANEYEGKIIYWRTKGEEEWHYDIDMGMYCPKDVKEDVNKNETLRDYIDQNAYFQDIKFWLKEERGEYC